MDRKGIVTGWNTQAESMFGWSRAEVLGQELAALIIPDEREEHRPGMRRYIDTGVTRVLGKRIETAPCTAGPRISGGARHLADRLRRIARVQRLHPRHHQRTRAEAALRESEQRFRRPRMPRRC